MAFFVNGNKIKSIFCDVNKLRTVFCNSVKVYISDINIKLLFKAPSTSDKFDNSELGTLTSDSGKRLESVVTNYINELSKQVPWNRYVFTTYVDKNNQTISPDKVLEDDMSVYCKADYGMGKIEFVQTPHVHFPEGFEARYHTYVAIPTPTYDTGYEKDGGFHFEQLVINDDGKTESWVQTSEPKYTGSSGNWKWLFDNPWRISQNAKRKTYTVSFDPNINTLNSMLLKAWSFSGIVYYKEKKSFYSTSAKPKAFSYLFEDTIGNVEIREKPSVTVDDNSYSITFDSNGGTGTVSIPLQAKHSQKAAPKADWYTTANGSQKWSSDEKISGNITLYAQWEIIEDYYTISPVDVPTVQKDHYDLLGWSLTKDGAVQESIQNQITFNGKIKQMSNVTIFAAWTPHKYTVTFNGNGHDIDNIPSQLVTYNQHADNRIPTGVNDGYTFVEWCTDAECTQKYSFNTPVTSDITLYAKWKLGQPEVVFNANGHGSNISVTVNYGDKVTKPTDPSCTGYTFLGWFTDANCTTSYDFNNAVKSNITLYAKWNINQYTVTFNMNGKGANTTSKVNYNSKVTKPANPTATGYTFGEWYTDSGCTKVFDFNTAITGNTTLYAKWNPLQYTVSFKYKTGRTAAPDAKVNHGNKVTKPAQTLTNGVMIKDWYTDANLTKLYDFNTSVTNNITLYAKSAYYYKIQFYKHDTNGAENPISTCYRWEGDKVGTIPTVSRSDTSWVGEGSVEIKCMHNDGTSNKSYGDYSYEKRAPWKLSSWNTSSNGKGSGAATITAATVCTGVYPNCIINCYAQWVKDYENKTINIKSSTMPSVSRSGYTFLGWYTAASGGTKITLNKGVQKDFDIPKTLYAHWQKK